MISDDIKKIINDEKFRKKYDQLSKVKKKIIKFIGDRTQPKLMPGHLASGNEICRLMDISGDRFWELVNELVLEQKLVSYTEVPSSSWIQNEEERKENEEINIERENFKLRLTLEQELDSPFNGFNVYKIILNEEYIDLHEKYKNLERQFDNIRMNLLQAMGLFVAIIALIIGNVQTVSILNEQPLNNILFMVLIVNATILLSIYFLMLTIRNVIFQKETRIKLEIIIWPVVLFALGIILYFAPYFFTKLAFHVQ